MSPFHRASDRPRLARLAALLSLLLLASLAPMGSGLAAAATPVTVGFKDFSYAEAPGGDDVTASRNQSKLWTAPDNRWFGILFDPTSTTNAKFRIWRFDMVTQNWTNTGVAVDDRNRSKADVLSDGNTLYVASSTGPLSTLKDIRIYKYAYNTTTDTYALVAGFPKVIPNTTAGTGHATIARDSNGRLWVAYTEANRVKISSSGDGAATWSAPIDLPNMGNDITSDDVAAIASFSGGGASGVGVMWSNENDSDDSFYFVAHTDGQTIGTWGAREVAFGTSSLFDADGHISLKTAPTGEILAAVKTARNDDPAPNGGDPLVTVLKRTGSPAASGTWSSHTVSTVTLGGTRPVLVIDAANSQANVFMTHPDQAAEGAQAIYRRTAPLSTLNFGEASIGTPFIKSATEVAINDATSSKQAATAATGMLVVATNIPSLTYLHNCAGGPCPTAATAPTANFTASATSGVAPLNVQFTDTSTGSPTSWSWNFGDGTSSTVKNPLHSFADAGTYTVSLTVTNSKGSDVETKTNLITVTAPPDTQYFTMTPKRILDTRPGIGIGLTGAFAANQPRTLSIAGANGIPADAIAITGNLTVVGQGSAGYISITKTSQVNPSTSNLNFPVGDNRANGVTIPLNATGDIWTVYKGSGSAHILLDVTGYFRAASGGTSYFTLANKRVLDTRPGISIGLSGAFVANQPRMLSVAGANTIPATAKAITGNLTVVGQTKAGYLSITTTSQINPSTSILNFPLGDTRANGVTVPLNATGDIYIVYKASGGTANVILDVTGYFLDGSSGLTFVPVGPNRVLDTRPGIAIGMSGTFNANVSRSWDVAGQAGVSADALAVVGNVTVVGQTRAGYVSLTPAAEANPTTSTINFPVGDTRANNFTVKLATNGFLHGIYKASSGSTHLIVDVTGYYK